LNSGCGGYEKQQGTWVVVKDCVSGDAGLSQQILMKSRNYLEAEKVPIKL